jgi:hypothetical protein
LEALAKYKGIDRDRFPTKELCFEIVATKFWTFRYWWDYLSDFKRLVNIYRDFFHQYT